MSHSIIRPLARPRNLIYTGMAVGALLVGTGAANLGRMQSNFQSSKRPLPESILTDAQMRQYSTMELAKEEAKVRAMDVQLGKIPDFTESAKFPLQIIRNAEPGKAEKQVLWAIELLKQVPMSGEAGKTWYDFFLAHARSIAFERSDEFALMRSDPKTGEVTVYVENLRGEGSSFKNQQMRIASSLVHEAGHIAKDANCQPGGWRAVVGRVFFAAADFFGIKDVSEWRAAFVNSGQMLQKERVAACIGKKFLEDAAKSGQNGSLGEIHESANLYTARLAYAVERLNAYANSVLMALSGFLMLVFSSASLAVGRLAGALRKPKQQ